MPRRHFSPTKTPPVLQPIDHRINAVHDQHHLDAQQWRRVPLVVADQDVRQQIGAVDALSSLSYWRRFACISGSPVLALGRATVPL